MLKKPARIAISAAGITVAIAAPIALVSVPMALTEKFAVDYYESGSALASLNHVIRGGTALSNVYGFFMEGLIKSTPGMSVKSAVDGVNERRGKQKTPFTVAGNEIDVENEKHSDVNQYLLKENAEFDSVSGDPIKGIDNADTPSPLINSQGAKVSSAMGDIILDNLSSKTNKYINVRIQEDAKWSNGVKIDADDFVQTIKYILDRKNAAVTKQPLMETIKLRGAREIVKLQEKTATSSGLSFTDAWNKVVGEGHAPVNVVGSNKRWVSYHFNEDGPAAMSSLVNYLGGNLFMPINKEFVDSIGGILRYGQTEKTTLSNGPFKISQMDLDYQITFSRNPYYYQKNIVFLEHPAYKVSPSQSIQMQLFKDKKLSSMDIPNELLQSFYSDPKLASLVGHGATQPITSGIQFSKYYADTHKESPINDKNFRKAIMYAINRKDYAIFRNASGSSPASSVFTPRKSTKIHGKNGKTYYDSLLGLKYKEKDPITNVEKDYGFESYDRYTKRNTYYAQNHNNEYNDEIFDAKLANDFLKKYLQDHNKSSVTMKIMITAAEEDSFLGIQSVLNSTFGGKVKVEPKLVAGQVMSEKMFSGDYQMVFSSMSTNKDDLWTFYNKLLIEDGYDENGLAYKDINGKRSMEATSRVVKIPGFVLGEYIKTLKPEELARLNLNSKTKLALKEAMINHAPTKNGGKPTYKYGVEALLMSETTDKIKDFGINKLSPYQGTDKSMDSEKIYRTNEELFTFFNDVEKLLRDSSYFIPLLNSTSGFFATRRALRSAGNTQGLPYGNQFTYPKDNNKLIDRIEAEVLANSGKNIVLERMS